MVERPKFTFSLLFILIAIIIFCLAAFGAHPGDWSTARLLALGSVFFAAGHFPL